MGTVIFPSISWNAADRDGGQARAAVPSSHGDTGPPLPAHSVTCDSTGGGRTATSAARRAMCPVLSWTVNTAALAMLDGAIDLEAKNLRSGAYAFHACTS